MLISYLRLSVAKTWTNSACLPSFLGPAARVQSRGAKAMARGSLPTNIFIDSPDTLLANPDEHVPEVGVNPLTWKDSAKFKLQQSQTRKKVFLDIETTEGIKNAEKLFETEADSIYQSYCEARYRCKGQKLKLVTTRTFGSKSILAPDFVKLSSYLKEHPQAEINWKLHNLSKSIFFVALAELGTVTMPLTFAQITVKFESQQSITFNPNKEAPPPADKPPRSIVDRIVFERCVTRKGASWRICANLPEKKNQN